MQKITKMGLNLFAPTSYALKKGSSAVAEHFLELETYITSIYI